jgi:hypothetical protein
MKIHSTARTITLYVPLCVLVFGCGRILQRPQSNGSGGPSTVQTEVGPPLAIVVIDSTQLRLSAAMPLETGTLTLRFSNWTRFLLTPLR